MATLGKDVPQPTEIKLRQKSRALEVAFADGKVFHLPCEFLRVFSPSAEVRGHGPGQKVLQVGNKDVEINKVEPVGNAHPTVQASRSTYHESRCTHLI